MLPSLLLDTLSDGALLALAGLLIGLAFGATANRSKFCLRAAVVEVARASPGTRLVIWFLALSTALAATQFATVAGLLDVTQARPISARGSVSGAIIGGLMFGAGMILARGCASRILILSATGNLRCFVSGLILTIVAQASLRGILAPVREWAANLWVVDGGSNRELLAVLGLGHGAGVVLGLAGIAATIAFARRQPRIRTSEALAGAGVGLTIAAGWVVTQYLAGVTFEGGKVGSVTFIGPSADTLMGLINTRNLPLSFDLGLIPGVFVGSLAATVLAREFHWQSFEGGSSMLRYIAGAVLMGFGGMLAGGCAVGAGVSGTAILAVTSMLALASMIVAAGITDRLLDREPKTAPAQQAPAHGKLQAR